MVSHNLESGRNTVRHRYRLGVRSARPTASMVKIIMHRYVVAFVAALFATAPICAGTISAAIADPARPAAQVATDSVRQPAATLAFAGVAPGMAVGEFFPGGGYFTRLLSAVVGPAGHIYGIENAGWKGAVAADAKLSALGNVSVAALPFGTVAFPVPLDLVWVTQNYHDLRAEVREAALSR